MIHSTRPLRWICLTAAWLLVAIRNQGCLANEEVVNRYIIEFDDSDQGTHSKQRLLKSNDADDFQVIGDISRRNIAVVQFSSQDAAEQWKANQKGNIRRMEKDKVMYAASPSNVSDEAYNLASASTSGEVVPWGITHIKADSVPNGKAGKRKLCILDSGYDMHHPDLPFDDTNTIITGESFVGTSWKTDRFSQGTRVAGAVVALGGNGIGVQGIVRNGKLKLHIAKVIDDYGRAYLSSILHGIESCIQNKANIMTMSFGGREFDYYFQDAVTDAYHNHDVISFASSGFTGYHEYIYPGAFNNVISVASITEHYDKSIFSTYNDKVDLSAPGSPDLKTTSPDGKYVYDSSGALASAYAAGVAALAWSRDPSLAPHTIISILESTAIDLPLYHFFGYDNKFGHGLVDAEAAVAAVKGTASPTPAPTKECEDIGKKKTCKQQGTCYWKNSSCFKCSALGKRNACINKGCTWNNGSCE